MNFLMTGYIFPLAEKIELSKKLKLYLDNPRTEEEIKAVQDYIEAAYSVESACRFPEYSELDIVTLESLIQDFCQKFSQRDSYVEEFCRLYNRDGIYEFMAKMWVVARYDDEGQHAYLEEEARKLREAGRFGFFMLDEDSPIEKNSRQLVDYSYLLSLLINTQGEDYIGFSFILDDSSNQLQDIEPNTYLPQQFFVFGLGAREFGTKSRSGDIEWTVLPYIKDNLIETVELVDSAFDKGIEEKLLYVSSLLKIAGHDVKDEKIKLVVLVSILELLLTHNPDFNRFNVEDSINKQFQLKASILIYLNDKSKDLKKIQKRLKILYGLRSDIAHGNFKSVVKFIRSLSKEEGNEEYFESLISELYCYIRAVLFEYMKDPGFVDFLKDN